MARLPGGVHLRDRGHRAGGWRLEARRRAPRDGHAEGATGGDARGRRRGGVPAARGGRRGAVRRWPAGAFLGAVCRWPVGGPLGRRWGRQVRLYCRVAARRACDAHRVGQRSHPPQMRMLVRQAISPLSDSARFAGRRLRCGHQPAGRRSCKRAAVPVPVPANPWGRAEGNLGIKINAAEVDRRSGNWPTGATAVGPRLSFALCGHGPGLTSSPSGSRSPASRRRGRPRASRRCRR